MNPPRFAELDLADLGHGDVELLGKDFLLHDAAHGSDVLDLFESQAGSVVVGAVLSNEPGAVSMPHVFRVSSPLKIGRDVIRLHAIEVVDIGSIALLIEKSLGHELMDVGVSGSRAILEYDTVVPDLHQIGSQQSPRARAVAALGSLHTAEVRDLVDLFKPDDGSPLFGGRII